MQADNGEYGDQFREAAAVGKMDACASGFMGCFCRGGVAALCVL